MKLLRAPFIAFVLTMLLLSLFYADELSAPNNYYFGEHEDGIKNYYSIAYHLQYDSSFIQFGGMSYPKGEHIMFMDGQPLITATLWFIPGAAPYTIGILNLIMLLGIGLSAWILCKLFMLLEMRRGRAVFAAAAIALLSPQILRFHVGHYALAFTFIIPWILYAGVQFIRTPTAKNSLWVFLAMNAAIWLHLYYLLIGAAFLGAYYLIEVIRHKQLNFFKISGHYIFQVILPFLGFFIWLASTDTIPDRPEAPHGMLAYMGFWEGVFLPYYLYHDSALFAALDVRTLSHESLAYAGAPAGLYFLYFLISRVKLFKKEHRKELNAEQSILLAGFLVFLFAATFPFALQNETIAGWVGPLKQFRSLGRLAWVFFYTLNIFLFIQLAKRHHGYGKYLFTLACVVLFFEGLLFHNNYSETVGIERHELLSTEEKATLPENGILFPYPFFHVGSENIGSKTGEHHLAEPTMKLSMETGLPTFATLSSRVSLSQTLAQMELAHNLSGPLMQPGQKWVVLFDPAYRHWTLNALLFGAKRAINKQAFTYPIYNQSSSQVLMNKRFYTRNAMEEAENTKPLMLEIPSEKGQFGGQAYHFPATEPTEILHRSIADSSTFTFWIKLHEDGFERYRVIYETEEENWEKPMDRFNNNVFQGFVRFNVPLSPSKMTKLSIYKVHAYEGEEVHLEMPLLYKKGLDYRVRSGSLIFTPGFVYDTADLD